MKTAIDSGDKILIRMFQRKESQGFYKDCIIRGEIISGKKKNRHSSGNAIQKGNVFLRRLDFHCRVIFPCEHT